MSKCILIFLLMRALDILYKEKIWEWKLRKWDF